MTDVYAILLEQRRRKNDAWVESIKLEAQGRGQGTEATKRYAALTLAQLAYGDAKTHLLICEQLLDDARNAVDDPDAPAVEYGRIPTPDFAKSWDAAMVMQNMSRQAASKVLARTGVTPNWKVSGPSWWDWLVSWWRS